MIRPPHPPGSPLLLQTWRQVGAPKKGAIAKTVAELTSQQDGFIRQQVIEQLMRQIIHYDGEFRREVVTSAVSSHAKH
jgi:hypothetical protein